MWPGLRTQVCLCTCTSVVVNILVSMTAWNASTHARAQRIPTTVAKCEVSGSDVTTAVTVVGVRPASLTIYC